MNNGDFRSWLIYHAEAFPDWWVKVGNAAPDTLASWRGVLVGITLEAARQATDDMLAGRIKRPFAPEEHITAIRSRASAIVSATMPVRDTRVNAHRCPLCCDSGLVSVLSRQTVERAQAGEYGPYLRWCETGRIGRPPARLKWYTCAMWCGCSIGERQRDLVADAGRSDSRQASWAAMPVYDVDRDVRVTDDAAEMIRRAMEVKPRNHVSDFDRFNELQREAWEAGL
jgi:hypothetical protein